MGHAVISVTMVCVVALIGLQVSQVDGNENEVVMVNQLAILEATHALKAVLNMTQDGQQQQCDAREELVSMRNILERSESALFNSSIKVWSALSDVPSTLQAIAQAADTYKPTGCDETKEVTKRLDLLISTVNESSATTAHAISELQKSTLMMMEVLDQSLKMQTDIYGRMISESDKAHGCCNGIQHQVENLTQVVTAIHELKSCRDGVPCKMDDNKKDGLLKPCDKQDRPKRHTSSSCPLCCYEAIGEIKQGNTPTVQTDTYPVIVQTVPTTTTERPCSSKNYTCYNGECVSLYARCNGQTDCSDGSDERDCPPKRVCCPGNFMNVGLECFFISKRMAAWFNARQTCVDMGGYIAKPSDTDSLAQYIRNYYENKRWYWIEWSNLDEVSRQNEKSVSVIEHNCHVFDAGQEDNQPNLQPSACSGIWYFICQHDLNDECASLKTTGT